MKHADALPRLGEYFDGILPPKEHREIEAHLANCPACREELSSLGALLDTVAEMAEKQSEPPRDLWPGIAARISGRRDRSREQVARLARPAHSANRSPRISETPTGPESRGRGLRAAGGRIPWSWLKGAAGLAAAAVLLLIVMRGADGGFRWASSSLWGSSDRAPAAAIAADSTGGIVTGEIAKLEAEVTSSRGQMPPNGSAGQADTTSAAPSWRIFDQGLGVLDQAIRDSREALKRDPHNPILQKSLLAAYQKQLELIRWANRVARQS